MNRTSSSQRKIQLVDATLLVLLMLPQASLAQGLPSPRVPPALFQEHGTTPMVFERNQGQSRPEVKFITRNSDYEVLFKDAGAVIVVPTGIELGLRFLGGTESRTVEGRSPQKATVSYFRGKDPSQWARGIPTVGELFYGQVFPGVDLRFSAETGRLELRFEVARVADLNALLLSFDGALGLRTNGAGNLSVNVGRGGLELLGKPTAHQEIAGVRREIDASYLTNGDQVGFDVRKAAGDWPIVLTVPFVSQPTGGDRGPVFAMEPSGRLHRAGAVYLSADPNPPLTGKAGEFFAAFVASFAADSAELESISYWGGAGNVKVNAIATDTMGSIYVTGITDAADFPITQNGFQQSLTGGTNSFVTKVARDGAEILYSTYLGGTSNDLANGLVVNTAGEAYVAGCTLSTDFPTSAGAFQRASGKSDGFAGRLSADGSRVLYATYIGGRGEDCANAIALDSAGFAYIAGTTSSNDFPTAAGDVQSLMKGESDAFVVKLNPAGTAIAHSALIGGTQGDHASAITIDESGSVQVIGWTRSPDFPSESSVGRKPEIGLDGRSFLARLDRASLAVSRVTDLGANSEEFQAVFVKNKQLSVLMRSGHSATERIRGRLRSRALFRVPTSSNEDRQFLTSLAETKSLETVTVQRDTAAACLPFPVNFFPSAVDCDTRLIPEDGSPLGGRTPILLIHGICFAACNDDVLTGSPESDLDKYFLSLRDHFKKVPLSALPLSAQFKIYRFQYRSNRHTLDQLANSLRKWIDYQMTLEPTLDTRLYEVDPIG